MFEYYAVKNFAMDLLTDRMKKKKRCDHSLDFNHHIIRYHETHSHNVEDGIKKLTKKYNQKPSTIIGSSWKFPTEDIQFFLLRIMRIIFWHS